MNLSLDIGNTRIKAGIFKENLLIEQANFPVQTLQELFGWLRARALHKGIVSTVSTPDSTLIPALSEILQVMELTSTTPLPFVNTYRTPETLGKDRVAAVAGAQALIPNTNCLVVDCGTCIKYELLTAEGVYLGGNIAPGALMRIRAMHTFTARLPEVPADLPDNPVGTSTETALQNGALLGAVLEIQGFAALFAQQLPGLHFILTGGDVALLAPHLHQLQFRIEPDLTLIGLNAILQKNIDSFAS